MCSTRSIYPWDIVVVKDGDRVYFDKRDDEEGPFGESASCPSIDFVEEVARVSYSNMLIPL